DPGREDWLRLIRDVLRRAELEPRLRERALDLAVLRDGGDRLSDAAYAILVGFAGDPAGDVSLRKQAVLRLLAFAREPARAETYVHTVLALLEDPDVSMRRVAAHQLAAVPEATQARRAEWLRQIVDRALRGGDGCGRPARAPRCHARGGRPARGRCSGACRTGRAGRVARAAEQQRRRRSP
ncbi:MAG: hypothetical protein ACO3RU_07250, partial [Planctomycetota bacterium]